jgi:hypothetical protein
MYEEGVAARTRAVGTGVKVRSFRRSCRAKEASW